MFKTLFRPVVRLVRRLTGTAALTESQADLASKLTELERLVRSAAARSDGATVELLAVLPDLRQRLDSLRDRSAVAATADALAQARAELLAASQSQADAVRAAVVADLTGMARHGFDDVLRAVQVQAEASRTEVIATMDAVVHSAEVTRSDLRDVVSATVGSLSRGVADLQAAVRLAADETGAVRSDITNTRLGLDGRLGEMHTELLALARVAEALADLQRGFTDLGLDRWKVQELEGLVRYLRRRAYEDDVAVGRITVPCLETRHPIAIDSDDTKHPWGAVNDNSICPRFNARLYELLGDRPRARVLDLGCAGGGFVRSLLDDGHFAVGLDGCDVPKSRRLGEWGTIPHHLFTCDVTKPFTLRDRATGDPLRFDAITAWELLEHIPEGDLDRLMANVLDHLAPDGFFLCSVSTIEDGNPEVGAVYHVTVRPRHWWLDRLAGAGLEPVADHPIGPNDWVRGAGNCRLDRRAEEEGIGFHLVLRRQAAGREMAA